MSQQDINIASKSKNKKTRRRKKRRTQDVSDSDSSSSSSSESEMEIDSKPLEKEGEEEDVKDVELSDVEISDSEKVNTTVLERLDEETKTKLDEIPLTTTELSQKNQINVNNIDLKKVSDAINESKEKTASGKDRSEMKNSYLNSVFEHYGEDINSLREAPDFTNKSLVLLASVLKDGGDMFDLDTFKTIIESK